MGPVSSARFHGLARASPPPLPFFLWLYVRYKRRRYAKYYVKVMKKTQEKGNDFPSTELARLKRILGT